MFCCANQFKKEQRNLVFHLPILFYYNNNVVLYLARYINEPQSVDSITHTTEYRPSMSNN